MPPITSLVLHIGVPKTGSSLIQRAMRTLRPRLRRRGIAAVDRSRFLKLPNHTAWAPYARDDLPKDPFLEEIGAMVADERSRTSGDGQTVLISNETASGRARDFGDPFWPGARNGVGELVEALRPEETHVVVYVRRQDRLLESLYMERIHRGKALEWSAWYEGICRDDRVRYTELIESVTEVPTVARVTVRPFETIAAGAPAFVADFFDLVGQRRIAKRLDPESYSLSNPSYTEPAWRAAMAINPLLDSPKQLTKLRRFLRDLFPADSYPKVRLLSDDDRKNLLMRYRSENERLFTRYLPGYPVDAYWSDASMAQLQQMRASQADGG